MRRAWVSRTLAAVWVVLGFAGALAGFDDAVSATTPPPSKPRASSVKDSPGYIPLVDPDSTSVLIGRRTNAPVVSLRFKGGGRSLDDLGRRVIHALNRSERDSLFMLCVTEEEFREILWREFPQSRPVTGLTWEDGWRVLYSRLLNGCSGAVRDHSGPRYEFVRFDVDSTMQYKNFRMHSRMRLVARDPAGQEHEMNWLRAVVERKGVFKIYSTTD